MISVASGSFDNAADCGSENSVVRFLSIDAVPFLPDREFSYGVIASGLFDVSWHIAGEPVYINITMNPGAISRRYMLGFLRSGITHILYDDHVGRLYSHIAIDGGGTGAIGAIGGGMSDIPINSNIKWTFDIETIKSNTFTSITVDMHMYNQSNIACIFYSLL